MRWNLPERDAVPSAYAVWKRAALGTRQVDPFCCLPEWQLTFHDVFHPGQRLLIREDSGSVIAFAEGVDSGGRCCLLPVETAWFFGCPVLGAGAVDLFAELVSRLEERERARSPRYIISGIRPGGRLARRLRKTFERRYRFYAYAGGCQCAASLDGGLDGYLGRRSANHRAKLKKAARKAKERGIVFERVVPATPAEAHATYARMQAVESKSWKGIGHCGMNEAGVRDFYALMLQRLSASRQGRVMFARCGEEDAGFIFGGLAGRVYRGQQFSFAQSWRDFSIGNLLQIEQIGWLCEEGVRRYDMGPVTGPRMRYKEHWTEMAIPFQGWIMGRR